VSTLVDWPLAERIAVSVAGKGPSWDGAGQEALRNECDRAVKLVRRYTGLRPRGRIPGAELVGRDEWVRTNLASFRQMSVEVERRMADHVRVAGGTNGDVSGLTRAAAGVEVGLATGFLAQRVVGQYDVALIGPVRQPRLLFVAPNLSAARERLDVERDLFLRWIAMHEATHAVQFAAVPWLREHVGAIAREMLVEAAVEVKPAELIGRLIRLSPRQLVRSVRAGEIVSLLWSPEQRLLMERLLAAMTLVEGYAEHVMDAVGDRLDPAYADLRRRLERDRDRRGLLDQVVSKLLGLEMKMAQYRRGKAFADEVVRSAGIRALNRAWSSPEALPSMEELDAPEVWLARVGTRRRRLAGLLR
jgi:coenzyme F420 biosynthesis associated uncharacterized protein